jgi:hypothetical protein
VASSYRQAASQHLCGVGILTDSLEIDGAVGEKAIVELQLNTAVSTDWNEVSCAETNGVPSRAELVGWFETQGWRSPSALGTLNRATFTVRGIIHASMSFQVSLIKYGSLQSYIDRLRSYDMKDSQRQYSKYANDTSGGNPVAPQPHGKDSYRVRTGRI